MRTYAMKGHSVVDLWLGTDRLFAKLSLLLYCAGIGIQRFTLDGERGRQRVAAAGLGLLAMAWFMFLLRGQGFAYHLEVMIGAATLANGLWLAAAWDRAPQLAAAGNRWLRPLLVGLASLFASGGLWHRFAANDGPRAYAVRSDPLTQALMDAGPRAKGQGPRAKGQGPRAKGQGPRAKGQGPRAKGQGPRAKGQGPRAKGQGPRAKGQGPRAKGQGPRAKGQGPRAKVLALQTGVPPFSLVHAYADFRWTGVFACLIEMRAIADDRMHAARQGRPRHPLLVRAEARLRKLALLSLTDPAPDVVFVDVSQPLRWFETFPEQMRILDFLIEDPQFAKAWGRYEKFASFTSYKRFPMVVYRLRGARS
jgi:hypothetical protein